MSTDKSSSELTNATASNFFVGPATPSVAPPSNEIKSLPAVAKPETSFIWNMNYAHLDMEGCVRLADDIVQLGQPEYFITANLNYAMLTDENPDLLQVNRDAAAIIADGNPIVWRSRFTKRPLPCRVAGSDMISKLAELASLRGYRIFFLGGEPGVAQAAADALVGDFPGLQVAGCYAPPFRKLTETETTQLHARIQGTGTHILLVAFGQPKGEIWIHENYKRLNVPLSIQLGASFDFLAGTAIRAPKICRLFACEWLFRAFCDPKRLFPRYTRNFRFLVRTFAKESLGLGRKKRT